MASWECDSKKTASSMESLSVTTALTGNLSRPQRNFTRNLSRTQKMKRSWVITPGYLWLLLAPSSTWPTFWSQTLTPSQSAFKRMKWNPGCKGCTEKQRMPASRHLLKKTSGSVSWWTGLSEPLSECILRSKRPNLEWSRGSLVQFLNLLKAISKFCWLTLKAVTLMRRTRKW